jgi:NADPH-dependent curcumin reductase CurA
MAGDKISVVIKSDHPRYKVGDHGYGHTIVGCFEEYVPVTAEYARRTYVVRNDAKENDLPPYHYVGILAMPGMATKYRWFIILKWFTSQYERKVKSFCFVIYN